MAALPILERELRVHARKGRTYWMRTVAGAAGVLLSLQFLLFWTGGGASDLAQRTGFVFQTLSWLGFLLACGGALLTVDSLSSERREGTLDLLLLTRARRFGVLSGKLTAHGLNAGLSLLALAPALMLPVLAGGVSWGQVTQTILALFSMLFFSLSLGLWVSSGSEFIIDSLRRLAGYFAGIVLLPLLGGAVFVRAGWAAKEALYVSPAGMVVDAILSSSAVWSHAQLIGLSAGPAYGVMMLLLASARVRRHTARHTLDKRNRYLADWPKRMRQILRDGHTLDWLLRHGRVQPGCLRLAEATRSAILFCSELLALDRIHSDPIRRLLEETHPVNWLLKRDRVQLGFLWAAAAVHSVILFSSALFALGGIHSLGIIYGSYLGGGALAAGLYAYAGARFPLEAKASGLAELLLTTPVGASELGARLSSVLWYRLAGPLAVTVAFTMLHSFGFALYYWRGFTDGGCIPLLQLMVAVALVILNAGALCSLGLLFGWQLRRASATVFLPLGLVWGLDLGISCGLLALVTLAAQLLDFPAPSSGTVHMILAPSIACLKQYWLIRWAQQQLKDAIPSDGLEPLNRSTVFHSLWATIRKTRQ